MVERNTTPKNRAKLTAARPVLMIAKEYPDVAPIIEREFKRICPTLELLDFNGGAAFHWIALSGSETELLRSGVIDSSMIAVRPKRLAWRHEVSTRRLAGDRVRVHLDLNKDLDRAHPLAPLAIWNWETLLEKSKPPVGPHTAPEWREKALANVDFDLRSLESWNGKLWRGRNECFNPRFRFAAEDISRMGSIIHRFRKELITAMEIAPVVDTQAAATQSHLRLVVDNTAPEVAP